MRKYRKPYKIIKPYFDVEFYLENNPDIGASNQSPILHYLEHGSREGRRPNPDFDPHFYKQRYAAEVGDTEPFLYYIMSGKAKGHATSDGRPYISYRARKDFPDYQFVAEEFDNEYYLNENPDIRNSKIDPISHYLQYGEREGRRPIPDFNPTFYAQ